MPTPEAIQALSRIIREQNQNNLGANINQYNIDEPDEAVDRFANSLLATGEQPQPEPTDNLSLLKNAGETLYKTAVAGGYEYLESAGFGIPGLLEAGVRDFGIQETAREFQEESTLAAIAGGIGTGAGYLTGAPVRGSLALARAIGIPSLAIKFSGNQSLKTATKKASKIAKEKGLDKKIVNDFSNRLATESSRITSKSQKASLDFAENFGKNINQYIGREMSLGRMTAKQASVVRKMQEAALKKGVPIQNLQQLGRIKYGNTFMGRVVPELLNDAFIFSIADATMDGIVQAQGILRDDTKEYNPVQSLQAAGYGFLGGTVINVGTSFMKPLAKMTSSRKDFVSGIRAYLGKNTFKEKDLGYLSKQLANMADVNKINGKSTKLEFEDNYIDLNKFNLANRELAHKNIERELVREFGDDAKNQAIKWLMSNRKEYGRQIIREASREGFENYKAIFPKMLVSGALMSGVSAFEAHRINGEVQMEDLISSFIIGSFIQRRGNIGKTDIGTRINRIRESLQELGVPVQNTSFASTLDSGNNSFGVGLSRDNPELVSYLKEQRIVSDNDETITQDRLDLDEASFLDYESLSGFAVDPTNGKFEMIHRILKEDFNYVKTLDQFSQKQVSEIESIFNKQGLRTIDDFRKAMDERVDKSTQGIEKSIVSVLEDIDRAGLMDVNITSTKRGIVIPRDFKTTSRLLKSARDGEFKDWLGKEGQEAEQEILDMFNSLEMAIEVSTGLGNAKTHKESVNTITSAESLKSIYNIVRDSEKAINNSIENFDGRKEFRFTDVESYLIPMIRNKGNNVTKKVMEVFSPDRADDKLNSLLTDVGILQDGKIIDDYSRIGSKSGTKSMELEKIHGIIKTLGKYDITDEISKRQIEDERIVDLKTYLDKSLGLDVDLLNKPNLRFMYQMVLNDINRIRLNNSVTSASDVNFIVKQSGNQLFSRPGLITDKGIRGFSLVKIDIPFNRQLSERYNSILRRLNEDTDGLVQIVDDPPIIIKNESTANMLQNDLDVMYSGENRLEQNIKLKELFELMNNSPLDGIKNKMREYISETKDGQIDVLSMLKRQGIIKKNVDGTLNLVNESMTLEKFEPIDSFITRQGFDEVYVEEQIKRRREIDRSYIGDASDVVKNPSINLDQFFNKYNFKVTNNEGNTEYVSLKNDDIKVKQKRFDSEIFDENFKITQNSIKRFVSNVSKGNKEFKNFSIEEKNEVIQDATQIVFGAKDKKFIRKLKIESGKVLFDDKKEVIQNNPVNKYFDNLGIDYSFFDNNVMIKEYDRSNVPNERVYNILQTESVPDELRSKIAQIRKQVQQDLAGATFNKEQSFFNKFDNSKKSDSDFIADESFIPSDDVGIKKLDIFDGMDSIVLKTTDVKKIVKDFDRFYEEHSNKVEIGTKRILDNLKKSFDETTEENFYDDYKVELASRYLILEAGYKSKENDLFYRILNSSESDFIDKYTKRIKLYSTKSFVRPTQEYILSLLNARTSLTVQGGTDKASELLKSRLRKKSHRVVVWDDDTETMSKIIERTVSEYESEYPELKGLTLENNIGGAHGKVSGFDSISYLSKDAMMEYHTYMGHSPESMNPIKPVISSQGEGKTLLYGKTLFVYDPSLEGFFKLNPDVDILITKSGAKAYDGDDNTIIKGKEWDELSSYRITNKNDLIRKIDIDAIGFRPEKDAERLSASEGVGDYNYMDISEHSRAFDEVKTELEDNLEYMVDIMSDPYKLNSFMQSKMRENNIPEDSNEGSLQHLSTLMYYLNKRDFADPTDYSLNQVQKYLAKEYIDNVFTTRRSITNRIQGEVPTESFRYGGQAPIIQSLKSHLGKGKKTRLLPTLFGKDNKMIVRGQVMLPDAERSTNISQLSASGKNIRIVQNERVLDIKEFIKDFEDSIPKEDKKYFDNAEELLTTNATLETAHDFIQTVSEITGTRYELGVISRRNPRTRPDDITLLGLKGFLSPEQGLAVEVNSFDIVNTYEGDYDADKVDYFFAHSDFMFDYINRNQAFHVQGIDPSDAASKSNFTFQMDAQASHKSMLQKIGTSIGYKRGIGIVQKTPRKINYLQNLGNDDYLFEPDQREKWDLNIKQNDMTGDYDGPALLYKSGDNEFVTVDTRTLAYYQRSAYETQYILDGANKLNPNISSNIYEWSDDFLFPENRKSISPKDARSSDLKEILENGQTVTGKRVRIFQKFKLEDGKYRATEDLNEADKLVLREFLNQQNKLLTAFGDQSYSDGTPRKSTFYDLHIGAKGFRDFHKDLYGSLKTQLFHKRKVLKRDDNIYLDELLNKDNGRFKPIDKKSRDIYDGKGGGYLDRIAVTIAKKDLMEDRKQYNLDVNVYNQVEDWFDSLISTPSNYVSSKEGATEDATYDYEKAKNKDLDDFSQAVVNDTKNFNKSIAVIKRLSNKKELIKKTNYGYKWKNQKIGALDYVIKKLKKEFEIKYQKDISKINPEDLKYKEYISVDDSNLKRSIVHANTMSALLRTSPGGSRYDSWTESLNKKQKDDLNLIKKFNQQTYGSNTLLDEIIPFGKESILTDKKMIDYVSQHSSGIANVFELRQRYLLDKINQHGIKFLYAYMEPVRNKDAIGVFNNRPISIPYKESKRFSHGIQILAGLASGKKTVSDSSSKQQSDKEASEEALGLILDANEYYRKFFNKDVSIRSEKDMQMDRLGIMPFDKNMQRRMKNNLDFNWLSESLPSNEFSTINKSVIGMYKDYAEMLPNKTVPEYEEFVSKLNDLEEFSYRADYVNPLKYMEKRLSLDEDFMKLSQQKIYDVEGDDGLPENLKNNKMYKHFEFIKFEPTLVKKPKRLLNMLKNINDVEVSLLNGVRQMPFKDSGKEKTFKIREALDCG